MILKSMSRKTPSFGQLVDYIAKTTPGQCFIQNLYAREDAFEAVKQQFTQNYQYLPQRKNGNALYHEVLSLEPQPHLSLEQTEAALLSLAQRYCQERAPNQLVWGRVHFDTDFPHLHLMISANAFRSNRRSRLPRKLFLDLQKDLEYWAQIHHPELNITPIYTAETRTQTPKRTQKEGERYRRTKQPSQKQHYAQIVQTFLQQSTSKAAFEAQLQEAGLSLSQCGKHWRIKVLETGRLYRLQTLGLAQQFAFLLERNAQTKELSAPMMAKATDSRAEALLHQRQRHAQTLLEAFRDSEEERER